MKRVGILGGGQLCLMLSESLHALGANAVVYDPDPRSPGRMQLAGGVTAAFDDAARLREFLDSVDVATYEFENVPVAPLRKAGSKTPIVPSLDVLEVAQDRGREKAFFVANDVPCVAHVVIERAEDVAHHAAAFGLPAILKTTRGGYDGKGQAWLRTADDAAPHALPQLGAQGGGWILEAPIDIVAEVSCIVARDPSGIEATFPVFENVHSDHILDLTTIPAALSPELLAEARELAMRAAAALGVVGLLTVEFFVGRGRAASGGDPSALRLFANEFAPRPHNSGHVSRVGCTFSQFDALARVLTGAPLGTPDLIDGHAYAMGNLLGDVWLGQGRKDLDLSAWREFPDVLEVFLYGKPAALDKRKMGHFIVRAPSAPDAAHRAKEFRAALRRAVPASR